MAKRKYLYRLQRIDANGRKETIVAWEPCKGWKILARIPYHDNSKYYLV